MPITRTLTPTAVAPAPPPRQTWTIYESPLGPLTLRGNAAALSGLEFPGRGPNRDEADRDPEAFRAAITQLDEYFAGHRQEFDLPIALGGTAFQQRVWSQLLTIRSGTTTTYGALADRLGRRDRVRAVAAAVGRTPVPIIVPCHRVLGANGDLTGYGGGLQRKQALLELEAAVSRAEPAPAVWKARQLSWSSADRPDRSAGDRDPGSGR
jgi:methylated-DNA-[protein]-cysteine S-methyltransferase